MQSSTNSDDLSIPPPPSIAIHRNMRLPPASAATCMLFASRRQAVRHSCVDQQYRSCCKTSSPSRSLFTATHQPWAGYHPPALRPTLPTAIRRLRRRETGKPRSAPLLRPADRRSWRRLVRQQPSVAGKRTWTKSVITNATVLLAAKEKLFLSLLNTYTQGKKEEE